MPRYAFRPLEELAWAAFVAAIVASLHVIVDTDVAAVRDWRALAVALGARRHARPPARSVETVAQ